MWCDSKKMCVREDLICNGHKDCSGGFDDEPDTCGKIMNKNYPLFPFFNHTSSQLVFKPILKTSGQATLYIACLKMFPRQSESPNKCIDLTIVKLANFNQSLS